MPYALNGGVKIHYEVRGEGLPIVLHIGGLGNLSVWESAGYVAGLKGFKCILIDPRGHGASDAPEDPLAHRVNDYVSDVVAVLDHLGIYRAAFFGFSNGGRVGFALCAKSPGRVTALIALDACVDPEETRARQLARFLRNRGIQPYYENLEAGERRKFPLWLRENFLAGDPEMFALEVEGFALWEGSHRLAQKITSPTLLLTGGLESSQSTCRTLADLIPAGAQLVVLKNLGHVGAFLSTDLLLPHVRDFLARVQLGLDRRYS